MPASTYILVSPSDQRTMRSNRFQPVKSPTVMISA